MTLIRSQIDGGHLLVRGRNLLWVRARVEDTADLEARFRASARDEVHDGGGRQWGLTPPVLRDVGGQAMHYLVPRTGPRGEMANRNRQACLLGPFLELPFPQAQAGNVAATAIGGDQQ